MFRISLRVGLVCGLLAGPIGIETAKAAASFESCLSLHVVRSLTGTALGQTVRRGRVASRYRTKELTDAGTIQGRVSWKGNLPESSSATIDVPADQRSACCRDEKKNVKTLQRLRVDPESKGIAETILYLKKIEKGKPMPKAGTNLLTGKRAVLDQINCRYVPHVLVVPRRTELTIRSSDPVAHNVNAKMGLTQIFNLQFARKGQETVGPETSLGRRTGIIELRCNAGHPWMSAYVFVVNHPYYTVTNAAGRFELKDVPPGEYTLVCWHESWTPRFAKDPRGNITDVFYAKPVTIERTVVVTPNQAVTSDFVLSRESSKRKIEN